MWYEDYLSKGILHDFLQEIQDLDKHLAQDHD
jgi:hypothetical protein